MTGHADGVITINLAEADDAERERRRHQMSELYRTLLGHFRHEIGHYYWDRLIADTPQLEEFRRIFGDERRDYAAALARLLCQRRAADWSEHFISAYASAHPWEDFAETWAHYFHMIDTLETAHCRRPCGQSEAAAKPRRGVRFPSARHQHEAARRGVAGADIRGQFDQSQHGPARSLSFRARPLGGREAGFRAAADSRSGAAQGRNSAEPAGDRGACKTRARSEPPAPDSSRGRYVAKPPPEVGPSRAVVVRA